MMEPRNPVNGTCMLMCPQREIEMRQRERLIHVMETRQGSHIEAGIKCDHLRADHRKMVKMFCRSAAGKDMLKLDELRPPPVLKKTVNYLLGTVVNENRLPWSTSYEFITDRLRAVRQDMIIQQPPPATCCALLEPMIRFHAYSSFRLCEEPLQEYDPQLNKTHLNETLKQLLTFYDTINNKEDCELTAVRDQMEAVYGLLHVGDVDALYRLLTLNPNRNSQTNLALRISLAHFHNDYVRTCRLLRQLPPLLACVASMQLQQIRRKALIAMNCAYSSKNLRYPLAHLCHLLLYSDVSVAIEDCKHYGLLVDDNGIQFLKGSFNVAAKECKPRKLSFVEDMLSNISLPELLLTSCEDEDC